MSDGGTPNRWLNARVVQLLKCRGFRWRRVAWDGDDEVEMIEHDRHGSERPAADFGRLAELSERHLGVRCFQTDRRTFHELARSFLEAGHVVVVIRAGQRMGDTRGLHGIEQPVLPDAADKPARGAWQPG